MKMFIIFFLSLTLTMSLNAITIKQLVDEALLINPNVKTYMEELKRYKLENQQAASGYYPKLDLSVSSGVEEREYENTTNNTKYEDSKASLTLSQNLFNGFETYNTRKETQKYYEARYYKLLERKK